MISASQSALSAIHAYGVRIQANSNNIANSATEGYKATRVTLSEPEQGGVKVNIEKVESEGPIVYERTNKGLEPIEQSNVDIGRELPEMMLNTQYFKANIATLRTADELFSTILDLKA